LVGRRINSYCIAKIYMVYHRQLSVESAARDSPAQSRQSAMLFLQSSELGPPPHPQPSVSPPLVPGGTHSLAGERVGGPKSDEGTDTAVRTLGILYIVRPAGLWPSIPKLETGLLNLQNVSTGRVKFTRESNQSQDQQSVPHNLGE